MVLRHRVTVCDWLPPCHEGAAGCRPDRHFFSVSLCKSSLAHLHASSLSQPFSVSRSKVSRAIFISFLGENVDNNFTARIFQHFYALRIRRGTHSFFFISVALCFWLASLHAEGDRTQWFNGAMWKVPDALSTWCYGACTSLSRSSQLRMQTSIFGWWCGKLFNSVGQQSDPSLCTSR